MNHEASRKTIWHSNVASVGVVVATLIMVAAVMVLKTVRHTEESEYVADVDHLKMLYDSLLSGGYSGDYLPFPKSTGQQFWQALFVGDAPGTRGGLKPEDAFLDVGDAAFLISTEDPVADLDSIREEIRTARKQGLGVTGMTASHCSYAGPTADFARRGFQHFGSKVIACTGSRNGEGFYPDGFAYIRGNQESGFMRFDDIALGDPEWDGDEEAPRWNSQLLRYVQDFEQTDTP